MSQPRLTVEQEVDNYLSWSKDYYNMTEAEYAKVRELMLKYHSLDKSIDFAGNQAVFEAGVLPVNRNIELEERLKGYQK